MHEVFFGQRLQHFAALVVKPAQLPPGVPGKRIVREDGHGDGGIRVANHRIGQAIGIHFPPAYGFTRCGAAQSARVRTRIGDLQEVILPEFLDAQHFLNLRFRLQHEVLGTAAAQRTAALLPPERFAART